VWAFNDERGSNPITYFERLLAFRKPNDQPPFAVVKVVAMAFAGFVRKYRNDLQLGFVRTVEVRPVAADISRAVHWDGLLGHGEGERGASMTP